MFRYSLPFAVKFIFKSKKIEEELDFENVIVNLQENFDFFTEKNLTFYIKIEKFYKLTNILWQENFFSSFKKIKVTEDFRYYEISVEYSQKIKSDLLLVLQKARN